MCPEFESEWFNKATSDLACFYGAMFIATAYRIRVFNLQEPFPPEFYTYKGRTIHLINQRMDNVQCRLEDGTIIAITCLAAFEVRILFNLSSVCLLTSPDT
jgi:hypothetical protein